MKTKLLGFGLFTLLFSLTVKAQVGVGNTNPQAQLDISASNAASPSNTDGILIPRMSAFPASPGATRDGMLIFYTGTGADGKGFYYWDQSIPDWVRITTGAKNTLDEAYDEGGAGVGRTITADNGAVQIDGNDGFQVTGSHGNGNTISLTGEGTRMFFNPRKSVFRAGNVSGNQWNDANVGDYSFAVGQDNTASGSYSNTMGRTNTASGQYSNAIGRTNNASGAYSNALGRSNTASGEYAIAGAFGNTASGQASIALGSSNVANADFAVALGFQNTASGLRSFASGSSNQASGFASSAVGFNNSVSGLAATVFGNANTAPSAYEFVVGTFNTSYTASNANNSNTADRVFTVGNGTGDATRSNALTIYKSGRMNINDAYNMPLADGVNGQVMTTDGAGNVTFQTNTAQNNSASNGLNEVGADIRLGGALTQNTTITQGVRSFDVNLNSTGDFAIQDNGTDVFIVEDTGDIGFGTPNPAHPLHVVESTTSELEGIYVDKNDNSTNDSNGIYVVKSGSGTGRSHAIRTRNDGSGTGQKYGVFNTISTTASGSQYGTRNFLAGASPSGQFGTFNNLDNNGTGTHYGTYNGMRGASAANLFGVYNEFERAYSSAGDIVGVRNRFTGGTPGSDGMNGMWTDFTTSANGNYYGTRTEFQTGATGTGNKYGTYNLISSSAGGTHYGTFNQVASANGWAGYFVGRSYMSERLGIGENDNTIGRLGVATNSGPTNVHIELKETGGNDGSRIRFSNPSEDAANWWTVYGRIDATDAESQFNIFYEGTGTNLMRLEGDGDLEFTGNLSVNLNNPTYAIQLPNNTAIGLGRGRANAWTTYSDSRVKSNQQQLENGLELINKMVPKTYFHHNGNIEDGVLNLSENGEQTLGFIAQELYEIFPLAVQKPEDENEALWSVNYDKIIPVAVKAIQELNTKVESLEAENKSLKQQLNKLEQLETRLSTLENIINNNTSASEHNIED